MLGPNLTSWAENVVKFQDKHSNKIIKTKKKTKWKWNWSTNENGIHT